MIAGGKTVSTNIKWPALSVAAIISVVVLGWAFSGDVAVCVRGQAGEYLQKTAQALDGTIDLELKLSVSLIGGGIALLIGLKTGVPFTPTSRTALLIAIILLGESVLLAINWRLHLANAWFNECLNILSGNMAQRMFNSSLYFFFAGLVAAFVMVIIAINQKEDTSGA